MKRPIAMQRSHSVEPSADEPLKTWVHAVSEVRAPIADTRVPETITFYREVFEFEPWPPPRQPPGALGLGPPRRGLLLPIAHDPRPDPVRRRIVLVVSSLAVLVQRLLLREIPFERARGVFASDDALTLQDPTGNRVEVRQFRAL